MCKNTKKTSILLGLSKFLYNFVRKKRYIVLFSGTTLYMNIINNKIESNYG